MEVAAKITEDVVKGIKAAIGGVVVRLPEIGLVLRLSRCVKDLSSLRIHEELERGDLND